MNCRRAKRVLASRGINPLASETMRSLKDHLGDCPACAATARTDAWLVESLASLRGQIPYVIDVRSRVMLEIERLEPVERYEVPAWQLGWAAAVAGLGVAGLLGLLWVLWPQWLSGLRTTADLAGGLADLLGHLGAALLAIAALPLELLSALPEVWAGVSAVLARLEPFAIVSVAICYLLMGGTIAHVVGRDLRQPVEALTHEE